MKVTSALGASVAQAPKRQPDPPRNTRRAKVNSFSGSLACWSDPSVAIAPLAPVRASLRALGGLRQQGRQQETSGQASGPMEWVGHA